MDYTKYEKVRIIGARALQIAMGAPILTERGNELNPIKIAKKEFEEGILPISVKRIMPKKNVKIKKKEENVEELPAEELAEEKVELPGEENKSTEA